MASDGSALKYRALTEISEAFLGARDLDALFRSLWDTLRKLIPFDWVVLVLINEQSRSYRIETIAGDVPPGTVVGLEMPLAESPSGMVWETQEPLYIANVETETRFRPDIIRDMLQFGVPADSGCR